MSIRDRFRRTVDTCVPYLVASPLGAAASPRTAPFGIEVAPEQRLDPHRVASGPFVNLLQRLDQLTFGPVGMTMPKWVFYDCAEVPGGIFGFARPADQLPEWVLRALSVDDDYEGLVPLSMFVAIPMLEEGSWHTYTLCSINEVAPGSAPAGLRLLTIATGLAVFPIERIYGATQWRSSKLHPLARFGPLELLTAWTPAHSDPRTLTYRFDVSPERLEQALSGLPLPVDGATRDRRYIDCDDDDALRALQLDLEAGRRCHLVGPPEVDGSYVRVPVRGLAS